MIRNILHVRGIPEQGLVRARILYPNSSREVPAYRLACTGVLPEPGERFPMGANTPAQSREWRELHWGGLTEDPEAATGSDSSGWCWCIDWYSPAVGHSLVEAIYESAVALMGAQWIDGHFKAHQVGQSQVLAHGEFACDRMQWHLNTAAA